MVTKVKGKNGGGPRTGQSFSNEASAVCIGICRGKKRIIVEERCHPRYHHSLISVVLLIFMLV